MKNMASIGFSKYSITEEGRIYSHKSNRFLNPYKSIDKAGGYFVHSLWNDDTKQKLVKLHRIVAIMYIPNPENKEQVNHIDGDKSNNKASNLEWCTAKENSQHPVKNKLYGRNTDSSRRVRRETTTEKVHAICKLIQQGLTNYKIADELDVCRKVVERIKNRKRYTEISKDYTW